MAGWLNGFLARIAALKAKVSGKTPAVTSKSTQARISTDPPAATSPPSTPPTAATSSLKSNADMWRVFKIRSEHRAELEATARRMNAARQRIESFIAAHSILARVPWWAIAIFQEREASGNYSRHAHNGDPLARPTVNVPANRPPGWMSLSPSERTWERSAIDAYTEVDKLHLKDWSTPGTALDALEAFNGMGYRSHHCPSAYLWSYTDQYDHGGYPRDGVWSDTYVSKQPGAAALMELVGAFPRT